MAVFLAVVAFTYGSITRGLTDGNSWSRMGLVFAIVERHELNIDPVIAAGQTHDWSRFGEHQYSNKAPGPALLAVPIYSVQHLMQKLVGVPDDAPRARDVADYVCNVMVGILPFLAALALFWTWLERRAGAPSWMACALCGTWAFSSLALPYSTLFFGHQTTEAFLAIGLFVSLLEIDRAGGPRPRWMVGAGLAMGIAVISDYLSGVVFVLWGAFLLWRARRSLVPWALGAAGPALIVFAYHAACFGSPFITPYSPKVITPLFAGKSSLEAPQLSRLLDLTVNSYRGLFYCTPVFALILIGLEKLREEARRRPEMIPAAVGLPIYLLILAGYPEYFAGWCIGPRYLIPAFPFAMLLLLPAAKAVPRLFGALSAAGAILMLLATLTDPLVDEKIREPFGHFLFPTFAKGIVGPMGNIFSTALGVNLIGAFAWYLAVWTIAGAWLAYRLRPARATLPGGR